MPLGRVTSMHRCPVACMGGETLERAWPQARVVRARPRAVGVRLGVHASAGNPGPLAVGDTAARG